LTIPITSPTIISPASLRSDLLIGFRRNADRLPSGTGIDFTGIRSPRVRDRLCQLIRQHQLDPDLVKAYAVDFCGTTTLKEASRAQVENFVEHLADWAQKDRNALLCQLNSYLPPRKREKGVEEEEEKEEKAGAA
jgi:hypothetical protein